MAWLSALGGAAGGSGAASGATGAGLGSMLSSVLEEGAMSQGTTGALNNIHLGTQSKNNRLSGGNYLNDLGAIPEPRRDWQDPYPLVSLLRQVQ